MNHQTSSFQTSDGLRLFTRAWEPDHDASTMIVLVHGIAEHSGRYDEFARILNRDGYAIYALDHRGHGRSEGLRAHVENFDLFVNDVYQYVESLKRKFPRRRVILMGHSMGAAIALQYAVEHQQRIDALILSGTPCAIPDGYPKFLHRSLISLGRMIGRVPLIPSLSASELSNDPEIVKEAENDPLGYHGWLRAGISVEIVRSSLAYRARAGELTLPILFIHGEADRICPVDGSKLLHHAVSSASNTLKIYPGMKHELIWGFEKDPVIADIKDWLKATLTELSSA